MSTGVFIQTRLFSTDPLATIRFRITGDRAYLTIKGVEREFHVRI